MKTELLLNPDLPLSQRVDAFSFVLHLIGDIHMPLHPRAFRAVGTTLKSSLMERSQACISYGMSTSYRSEHRAIPRTKSRPQVTGQKSSMSRPRTDLTFTMSSNKLYSLSSPTLICQFQINMQKIGQQNRTVGCANTS